ncbi:IMPACT family protein [Desulfosporosinus hippei]|uniref:Uncharacterized protein, YigZ family n=1 Tax=Desulfosporosinus hippei DSM 8344 TaxID=1121419 RepID=A0A1G7XVB4_9FIRM|nr:YigZ family protein [Desulfosporosinus hippei]SDG87986.1 uncharacterized protein, YigZ family [Desulfosporosinus hippei DSM 8344]
MKSFNTISELNTWEQIIDKSRFIGIVVPLTSIDQLDMAMKNIRDNYPNARHYVYAYRLYEGLIEKSSDDGEPQGTGGRPVMDILQHGDIWNVLVVVVRYFGGVLLGTGGLSRAYGGTARQLINETNLKKLSLYQVYHLNVPYEWYEMIKYQFGLRNWLISKEDFSEVVQLLVHVPEVESQAFTQWINDFSKKQVSYTEQSTVWR